MADGIENLIGDEVQIGRASGAATHGVLRGADDYGVLISGKDPESGPVRVFTPWARIAYISAPGEYGPPKRRGASGSRPSHAGSSAHPRL